MEHEEDLLAASPRKHSDSEAGPSDGTSQSLTPKNTSGHNIQPFAGSLLENRAIELYCGVLLSRAHFLFFNSIRFDHREKQLMLLNQGRDILEKAESLCVTGQDSVSDQLIAKCWYVRGFCADINHDKENAEQFFDHATSLDEKYKTLKRVEYYKLHRDIWQGLEEEWDRSSQSSEYGNRAYRMGEHDSPQRQVRRASIDSHDTQDSVLFSILMDDVKKAPRSSSSKRKSAPTTPTHVHHAPPIATPPHAIDKILVQIREAPSKAATRRPSEDILNTLREHENSPEKDKSRLLAERRQAELEAAERQRCASKDEQLQQMNRWRNLRRVDLSPKRIRLPTTQETLLPDLPSVEGLDAPKFSPANRTAASPTSPTMPEFPTQGIRRSSASLPKGSPPSSPLRKSSIPGERDSDESSE